MSVHRAGGAFRRSRLLLCVVAIAAPLPAARGQEPSATAGQRLRPLAFFEATRSFVDFLEENTPVGGVSGRLGVRLPSVDVSVAADRWNEWGGSHLSSALLEADYFPFGGGRVAPFAAVGLGLYRYGWRGEESAEGFREVGSTAALGLGVQAALRGRTALRTEAALRVDGGGFNGQLRVGLGYAAEAPAAARRERRFAARPELELSWMAPVRGPWRFVQPGLGVRFERPAGDGLSGTLGFEVYHWRIPQGTDTRAFVGTPGVEWRPLSGDRLALRGGLATVLMGEGPDGGLNLGLHAAAVTDRLPLGLPFRVGVGWLWMPRGGAAEEWPGTADQQGLMLFGGLRL